MSKFLSNFQRLNPKNTLLRFKEMPKKEKIRSVREFLIDNLLYILLVAAIIGIQIYDSRFLSISSIINILSLSAANLPIALGIAGCIILTGTDLSAGRIVGVTACVATRTAEKGEGR